MAHCPDTTTHASQHSQAHPAPPELPGSRGAWAPRGPRTEVPSGTVLQVPSPGLATVGSRRGLTFWGCLRVTGAQGWAGAGAKCAPAGQSWGQPGRGAHLHLPLSPTSPVPHLGWAVTPLPSPWHRLRGSGGCLPASRFGTGCPGPAVNTWALKSHPGHSRSMGCRSGVPRGSCDMSWSPLRGEASCELVWGGVFTAVYGEGALRVLGERGGS